MRKSFFILMSVCLFSGFITTTTAQPVLKKIIIPDKQPGELLDLKLEGKNLLQVVRVYSVFFDGKKIKFYDDKIESDTTISMRIRYPYGARSRDHKIKIMVLVEGQESPVQLEEYSQNVENTKPVQDDSAAILNIPQEAELPSTPEKLIVAFDSSDVWSPNGKSLVLRNSGRDTLTLSRLELPAGFKSARSMPLRILPLDSVTIPIQLDLEVMSTYNGKLQFSLIQTEDKPFDYQISAVPDRDLGPSLELSDEAGQTISEQAIDFGETTLGTPIRKTFTIRNTGLTRLVLNAPKLPEGFGFIGSFPEKVDAGEVATYTVELNADSARKVSGNIKFETNIAGQRLVSFPVMGIVNEGTPEPPPARLPVAAVVTLSIMVGLAGSYFLVKGPVRNYRLKKSLSGKPTFQFKPKMDEGFQSINQATPLKSDFEVRLKPILDYGKQTLKFKKVLIRDEAVKTEKSKSTKADDLTRIEGIGPVISDILKKSGITTFRQLAEADVEKIQQMLHDAGITGIADPATWPLQAELAASKQWKQLEKLQEELKGGRVVHEKV